MVGTVERFHCISRELGRRGQAFWQDESDDHLVRCAAEFDRIRFYSVESLVAAGLVMEAEQYPWSSAAGRLKGGCGKDWPPHCRDSVNPPFPCRTPALELPELRGLRAVIKFSSQALDAERWLSVSKNRR